MLSVPARLVLAALVLALTAAGVSPAKAGCVSLGQPAVASDLTVELARGVTGQRCSQTVERYAPTGETIDTTLVVTASRLVD